MANSQREKLEQVYGTALFYIILRKPQRVE